MVLIIAGRGCDIVVLVLRKEDGDRREITQEMYQVATEKAKPFKTEGNGT